MLLFCTDLHGSELTFRKLLGALALWKVDLLILGGDVAGKTLLPAVDEGDLHRVQWLGQERVVDSDELAEIEAQSSNMGYYPLRVDRAEYSRLSEDEAHRDEVWDRVIAERWEAWLAALERRCSNLELPAFVIAGNDDPWSLDEVHARWQGTWVKPVDGRVVPLTDGLQLLSCGLANPTPWDCPRDVSERALEEALDTLHSGADPSAGLVANIHVPPFNSGLDLAPQLDESTDPPRRIPGMSKPVGSSAVRGYLERAQPLVSLHGHIHESPGAGRIGRTLSVNPGSEYGEGVLRGARITLGADGDVKGHQFVTG